MKQQKIVFINDSKKKYPIKLPNLTLPNKRKWHLEVNPNTDVILSLPEKFNSKTHDLFVKVWNNNILLFSCIDKKIPMQIKKKSKKMKFVR